MSVSASNNKYVYSDNPFEIKNIEAKEKLNEFLHQRRAEKMVVYNKNRIIIRFLH